MPWFKFNVWSNIVSWSLETNYHITGNNTPTPPTNFGFGKNTGNTSPITTKLFDRTMVLYGMYSYIWKFYIIASSDTVNSFVIFGWWIKNLPALNVNWQQNIILWKNMIVFDELNARTYTLNYVFHPNFFLPLIFHVQSLFLPTVDIIFLRLKSSGKANVELHPINKNMDLEMIKICRWSL